MGACTVVPDTRSRPSSTFINEWNVSGSHESKRRSSHSHEGIGRHPCLAEMSMYTNKSNLINYPLVVIFSFETNRVCYNRPDPNEILFDTESTNFSFRTNAGPRLWDRTWERDLKGNRCTWGLPLETKPTKLVANVEWTKVERVSQSWFRSVSQRIKIREKKKDRLEKRWREERKEREKKKGRGKTIDPLVNEAR